MTSLPQMGSVLDCFLQTVVLKTVSVSSVDFVETETVVKKDIRAVVQPASPDALAALNIDHSQATHMMHTKSIISEGQFVEYLGKDYKIINILAYGDYGYHQALLEETKRPLL